MVEHFKQKVEFAELPNEAGWGTRTVNAIKAQWRDAFVQRNLNALDERSRATSDKLAVAAFQKDASTKRIDELQMESQTAEFALESKRNETLHGSGWTSLFGTPERTFRRAQKKYSYEQRARESELRMLEQQQKRAEGQIASLTERQSQLETKRLNEARAYERELDKKAKPLDTHWDALTTRRAALRDEIDAFSKLKDESQTNIERIMHAAGSQKLSPEQKTQLKGELARAQQLLRLSEAKIGRAKVSVDMADKKMEQLSKARAPFMRFQKGVALVLNSAPEGENFGRTIDSTQDTSADFLPQIDSISLGSILDLLDDKEVRIRDYFAWWNKTFPHARVKLPDDIQGTASIAHIETALLDMVVASENDTHRRFLDALTADGGIDEDTMRKRFRKVRIEALTYIDL